MNVLQKNKYSINDFISVVHRLRAPGGCPWDMEQTHKSIRRDFLEETYEAIEAIDCENSDMLREELGDVLLQVVFHCIIEEEENRFTFDDVVNDITEKMIVRHPHVFADTKVGGVDDVLTNWDSIKKETKGQKSDKEMLQSVSKAMPALMRSQKVQKKAGKLGVALSESPKAELIAKLQEKDDFTMEEVGELQALLVSVAAKCGVDAEEALSKETDSFIENNF